MAYYFGKTLTLTFEKTLDYVKEALTMEGFGVITEIDVQETLKKKIGVDFASIGFSAHATPRWLTKRCRSRTRSGRCCHAM